MHVPVFASESYTMEPGFHVLSRLGGPCLVHPILTGSSRVPVYTATSLPSYLLYRNGGITSFGNAMLTY